MINQDYRELSEEFIQNYRPYDAKKDAANSEDIENRFTTTHPDGVKFLNQLGIYTRI